jgi:hypothetical protein
MKKSFLRLTMATVLAGISVSTPGFADLVRNPTAVGASFDIGQIVQGTLYDGSNVSSKFNGDKQQITRTGVYLTESGTYHDRLSIYLTIGGLFWYALPEGSSFQTHRIYFGPGVGQAQGTYNFGSDPKNPAAALQFGLFNYKYSEAFDLGEYLYRSGTYPGLLVSGGWSYINAASYMAQGFRLNVPLWEGKISNDFTLFMERDLEPTNDLSPGYLLKVKPIPALEIGGGLVWSHAISLNGARLDPKKAANEYSIATGRPSINNGSSSPADTCPCGYWTFKGFKTMGRVSLDIGQLMNSDLIHPGDFKLYSEIALLGIEDQPFFYTKKSERMPMMAGINIPTFGILDQLSFEVEYHKSPYPNTNGSVLQSQLPIPINDGQNPFDYDLGSMTAAKQDSLSKAMKKDDVKWAIYARRTITKSVSITAQAANDYLRHFNFTASPSAIPATSLPSDWYYVLRLEFGI